MNLGCFCLVVQLTAICSIIVYAFDKIFLYDMPVIIGLCILAASTIFTLLLISVQPENKAALFFRVPVVPWLPALSLFINIYLIMLLDRGSWIRFGIWLSLGMYQWSASMLTRTANIIMILFCNALHQQRKLIIVKKDYMVRKFLMVKEDFNDSPFWLNNYSTSLPSAQAILTKQKNVQYL